MKNALYFGDNLEVMRASIADESVDLIYLDPPFNSNASYNVLFKTPKGHDSDAQIEAFDDTWTWGEHAEAAYADVMQQANTDVTEVVRALRSVLGENDVMAYIVMMAIRLLELRRVLKPTGSLFLHCDPTASHYLKIVLDQVFGVENFRNEIVWKRTGSHNSAKRFGPVHDTIFYYTASDQSTWNQQRQHYADAYKEKFGKVDPLTGGQFQDVTLTGPGTRKGASGQPWRGFDPTTAGRHWQPASYLYTKYQQVTGNDLAAFDLLDRLDELDRIGLLYWPKNGGFPRYKQFLADAPGLPIQDVWTDIDAINSQAAERLGYPTQKPLALLERIIAASSNEGDVVLDPFCGCGTAVDAAEKLKRTWIGIDITHLAVSLMERRMRERHPGCAFEVHGTPKDADGARNLAERDKHQFQLWACALINAKPYKGGKKGADSGIDGLIFFQHDAKQTGKIVVSVKGGEHISVKDIRDLGHVIERENAAMGLFVTLNEPTKPMVKEAAGMGFYTSPLTSANFPRLQILTAAGLLARTEAPRYPNLDAGGLTFKRAKREEKQAEQRKLL